MILVTGSNGQLGNELKLILKDRAIYSDMNTLDITDGKAVSDFCIKNKISKIINCAAYTAVDKAEEEIEKSRYANAIGPRNLALTKLPIIHISTDYVFDGSSSQPYIETDIPNPLTVYGVTKLEGENEILKNSSSCFILRTSWLYSKFGNNFVKTMIRLGKERDEIRVVFDQIGTPTYAKDISNAIVMMLDKIGNGKKEIYNFSNEGICSWYDFATKIMELSNIDCKVLPIESVEYPTPAKRPFYSVLNKNKIKKDFNIEINHWEKSLSDCLKNMEN